MLGTCDKRQYEHNGPHEEVKELCQTIPPFPCENWVELEEENGVLSK